LGTQTPVRLGKPCLKLQNVESTGLPVHVPVHKPSWYMNWFMHQWHRIHTDQQSLICLNASSQCSSLSTAIIGLLLLALLGSCVSFASALVVYITLVVSLDSLCAHIYRPSTSSFYTTLCEVFYCLLYLIFSPLQALSVLNHAGHAARCVTADSMRQILRYLRKSCIRRKPIIRCHAPLLAKE
jgi:hypothetical protein